VAKVVSSRLTAIKPMYRRITCTTCQLKKCLGHCCIVAVECSKTVKVRLTWKSVECGSSNKAKWCWLLLLVQWGFADLDGLGVDADRLEPFRRNISQGFGSF